jgi:hypothetical protein
MIDFLTGTRPWSLSDVGARIGWRLTLAVMFGLAWYDMLTIVSTPASAVA